MIFEYPYTNLNQPNLDGLIRAMRNALDVVDNFTALNELSFAGDWDIAKAYTKWSIVQAADGNGYISVKPVPYNVLLSNAEYWRPVANYDALYAAFNQRITTLESDVNDINGDISDINSDIGDIHSDIGNLETADESIRHAIHSMRNRHVVMIGDSYSMGSHGVDGHGWPYYLQEITGCNADVIAQLSGGGFIAKALSGDYQGKNYEETLNTVYTAMSAANRAAIDYVIVCGGINDIAQGSTSEIGDAVTDFCITAKTLFPYAKLVVLPLYSDAGFGSGYWNDAGVWTIIYNGTLKYNGLHAVYDYAITHGAISTPNSIFWLQGRTAFGSGDGIHPNDAGYRQQGRRIAAFIEGGASEYDSGAITSTNADDSLPVNWTATARNGIVHMCGEIRLTNPATFKPIIKIAQNYSPGTLKYFPVVLNDGHSTWINGQVVFDPTDKAFELRAVPEGMTIAENAYIRIFMDISFVAGT